MAEDEAFELVAQIGRRPKRGEGGRDAFFPRPQPDRVNVGVADEKNPVGFVCHLSPPCGEYALLLFIQINQERAV